jgi:integrase/recombinase XerD
MSAAKSLASTELEQLLDYIATKPNAVRNRAMFMMTLYAGLRVSEVAGLMLADVVDDRDHIPSEIFLAAHRVKHAHARII